MDETASLENFYSTDDTEFITERSAPATRSADNGQSIVTSAPRFREAASLSPVQQSTIRLETTLRSPNDLSPISVDNSLSSSGTKRRRTNDLSPPPDYHNFPFQAPAQALPGYTSVRDPVILPPYTPNPNSYGSPTELNETRRIEQEYARIADHQAAQIPDEPFLSVASWKKNFRWPNQYTTQQCRVLFKYYIDVLGPWVSENVVGWDIR